MSRLDYWLDLVRKAWEVEFRGDSRNRNKLWEELEKAGWLPYYTDKLDLVISALEAVLLDIKKEMEKNGKVNLA